MIVKKLENNENSMPTNNLGSTILISLTACESTCATCNGPTSSDCLTCVANNHFAAAGGGTCAACHGDCEPGQCTEGGNGAKCTQCASGSNTFPTVDAAEFACAGEAL